jgi:hypothetical protein
VKRFALIVMIGIMGMSLPLGAVVPRKWQMRTKDDFLKGKLDGVSVSFEGVMSLAPREDKIEGPSEDFFLSLIMAPDGTVYLGTGHGGKIYRIGKDGKAELYAQTPEMDVTCLALDAKGALYAGTSPNGKIYKFSGKGQPESFFNPGEKYIWDMQFIDSGFLLAAVGETGGIYRISPQGDGQLVLRADENHVLCLIKGNKGEMFAGTGGVGAVYRISPEGRVSALFESPYEEIRSLAVDSEGRVYAGAGGTPSRARREEPTEAEAKVSAEVLVTAVTPAPAAPALPAAVAAPAPSFAASTSAKEPGAVYRISSDGIAEKLWESTDELVYSVVWRESEKKLVFGTGTRGRVYAVDKDDKVSLLTQENSEQVYSLVPQGSKLYMLANNPVRLAVLTQEPRTSGEYTSDVLDAKTISSWGKLDFDGQAAAGTTLQLVTRSGNSFEPNSLWSDWSPPIQKLEEQILSPKARYLQLKALFKAPAGNASPKMNRIALFYLQTNLAPSVGKLELLPANDVYLKPPEQDEVIWGAEDIVSSAEEKKPSAPSAAGAKKVERKGYQTVVWDASDENGDALVYRISIKKEGETAWRVVKENWRDSLFVFDTISYPDGPYTVKIEASDSPSNPPGTELKTEKTSDLLLIDNSLPVIKNLAAVRAGNSLDISFDAEDSFSAIEQAEVLVRPGEWRVVFPVDGICDSKQESFKLRAPLPANAENMITVRVTDQHHNVGVSRLTF